MSVADDVKMADTHNKGAAEQPRLLDGDASAKSDLLRGAECFVFDCDGVIWNGAEAIPGACEAL